jgi:hypothetical protein
MKRTGLIIGALGLFLFVQAARAAWSPAQRLTFNSGDSSLPAIAVDNLGRLHAVWGDTTPGATEIYYRRSSNGGATWGAVKRLTFNSGVSQWPAIAADSSGNLHVVWQDDTPGNAEIYYLKSTDGGISWTAPKRLTWTGGTSWNPAIAVGSYGYIHVTWEDTAPGNYEIYYKRSTDGGADWTTARRITWDSGFSGYPVITIDPYGNPHVFWEDDRPGNLEIYYCRSWDTGASWDPVKRITWSSGSSSVPAIALDPAGYFHLVWSDVTTGNYEIYYKNSTNGGFTWTTSQKLTSTSGSSGSPDLAIDGLGHVHLVWSDNTPGNFEIYYKQRI